MQTDDERLVDSKRYIFYSLAAMTLVLLAAFIFLFNFTSFFKLAVPL